LVNLAEVCEIVHNIKHNLSYNSLDCDLKFLPKIFIDSNITSNIFSGRLKVETIVQNKIEQKSDIFLYTVCQLEFSVTITKQKYSIPNYL